MAYNIGVMQGRLLPKYQGRYQAHPVGYWQDEFSIAKNLNLSCVEFIFDYNEASANPLVTDVGFRAIQKVCVDSGVGVRSVCADYFMQAPLHSADPIIREESLRQLKLLLRRVIRHGVTDVVIPCVDQSSLIDREAQLRLIDVIQNLAQVDDEAQVNLSLETDLGPQEFSRLLEEIGTSQVTVNYDIGNSASLGYDTEEEISCYGRQITDVHIKDRIKGGGSVELGTGDADIEKSLSMLAEIGYSGLFIMQAFRDDEGLAVFEKQLQLFRNMLKNTFQLCEPEMK